MAESFPEFTLCISILLFCFSVYVANPMFQLENRPMIFWGKGEYLFSAITTIIFVGGVSLCVWGCMNLTWYKSITVFIISIWLFPIVYGRIPFAITSNAVTVILCAFSIIGLNMLVWL